MQKLIAYYRVSTKGQRISGLGLADQRATVEAFAKASGDQIVAEYTEQESGKRSDRPQLLAALSHSRAARGKLVVAKIDRLSRNVAFLATLMESGCKFVACDNPAATELTINILSSVAQEEARAISDRTTRALAQARKKGKLLGTHNPKNRIDHAKGTRNGLGKAVAAAAAKRAQRRNDCWNRIAPEVQEWRKKGDSFRKIAEKLNERGDETTGREDQTPEQAAANPGKWYAATVRRLLG